MKLQRLNTFYIANTFGADFKLPSDLYELEGDEGNTARLTVQDILNDKSFDNF